MAVKKKPRPKTFTNARSDVSLVFNSLLLTLTGAEDDSQGSVGIGRMLKEV